MYCILLFYDLVPCFLLCSVIHFVCTPFVDGGIASDQTIINDNNFSLLCPKMYLLPLTECYISFSMVYSLNQTL